MVLHSDGSVNAHDADAHYDGETPPGGAVEQAHVGAGNLAESPPTDALSTSPSLSAQSSTAAVDVAPSANANAHATESSTLNVNDSQQQGHSAPNPSASAVAPDRQSGATVAASTPTPRSRKKSYGPVVGGQQARNRNEVLSPHPVRPGWLIARFRVQLPGQDDEFFEQVDEIPELDPNAVSPVDVTYYFLRNPQLAKIPSRKRANKKNGHQPPLWVRQPGTNTWRRPGEPGEPDDIWELAILFRRFNAVTHSYEEAYLTTSRLINVDPNDKAFMYAYNKWIDQFRRRRDGQYEITVKKDHWTVPERRALMEGINTFVARKGLKNFGAGASLGMSNADMQVIADHINAIGGNNRGIDATRAQIISAHVRKNKAIFELRDRAEALRNRLANGDAISRAERYPQEAIPRSQFPVEDKGNGPKKPRGPRKPPKGVQSDDHQREQSLTPAADRAPASWSRDPKWPNMGGKGLGPTWPDMVKTSIVYGEMPGWEDIPDDEDDMEDSQEPEKPAVTQQDDEMAWESTSSECAYAEFDEDSEPDEQDNEELSRQEAIDLQRMIAESIQDQLTAGNVVSTAQRGSGTGNDSHHTGAITTGMAPPGDSSDSDSGSNAPTRAPVTASGSLHQVTTAGTPTTPEQGKRKRTSEADEEDEGSAGDDEAEISPPQARKTKKARMASRK
tara:strand:- start:1478 stop:3502 length:2025 start_codon:yes stop_codon:yes gene_type:complete